MSKTLGENGFSYGHTYFSTQTLERIYDEKIKLEIK